MQKEKDQQTTIAAIQMDYDGIYKDAVSQITVEAEQIIERKKEAMFKLNYKDMNMSNTDKQKYMKEYDNELAQEKQELIKKSINEKIINVLIDLCYKRAFDFSNENDKRKDYFTKLLSNNNQV